MVLSATITDKIRQALSEKNWRSIEEIVTDTGLPKGKRARKALHNDINFLITDAAFGNNQPEFLSALRDISCADNPDLFYQIIRKYIATKDEKWLLAFYELSKKLERKSTRSRIFAVMAKELISTGVSESNPVIIEKGLKILDNINFRKYRSDSMIDIIPLLIVWSITRYNVDLLYRSRDFIQEINDISKRAVLHAEISQAIATIAIHRKDRGLYFDSIRNATDIRQKLRRNRCISVIIEKGAKSVFGKEILDIQRFIQNFADIAPQDQAEIIDAVTWQVLDRIKDKDQINRILSDLCETQPFVGGNVILSLLKKAEKSGESWYLSDAIEFRQYLPIEWNFPIREVIHAGIAVAGHSRSMKVLADLVPLIDTACDVEMSSRIYLQFTQIMLSGGDFNLAAETFGKIEPKNEILSQYIDCLTHLLKEGIFQDRINSLSESIFKKSHENIFFTAVNKAVNEASHEMSFQDIVMHLDSLNNLILLHPKRDQIFLDCVVTLVNRGFLDGTDPDILVKLAESIKDPSIRERAISTIIIKIAKIGAQTRNRDFLQRAVGITCLIEGQNTRSATLSSIIDEASILAATQGDLDLLLRMRAWSSSLLDDNLITYAMANIIDGVIKYATDKQSPDALEDAYLIARDIADPSLRMQLCEHITECLVKIGCALLQDQKFQDRMNAESAILQPFSRGLQLLKNESKKTQLSLKIARMIDIILSYSRKSANPDYIVPLVFFSVEIENPFERNAMLSRIVSNLNEEIDHPDSADPYEIMAYLLQRNYHVKSSTEIIDLIDRLLHFVNDPYVKLHGMCNLADTCIRIKNNLRAEKILDEAYEAVGFLHAEYQKVLILADLTTLYCYIDPTKAKTCLDRGLQQLTVVEFDSDAIARRQIVAAMVSLNTIMPNAGRIALVLQIIEKIIDPVEYVNALLAAYAIVREDKEQVRTLIRYASEAIAKISSPYDKALLQLEIFPLALQSYNDDTPLLMLRQAEDLAATINISFIADTIRDDIARLLFAISETRADNHYRKKAIEVLQTIDDDELRQSRLLQAGLDDEKETVSPYGKIRSVYNRVIEEGTQHGHAMALERMVRSVADRGKEAVYFCSLSILFRKNGDMKMAKKMLQYAIKEASIIRPLSRRGYVLCDIAMKTYAAGCETEAQDILECAMDAATNIRQSSLRDTVFNELELAIRIMQGLQ
jgi:hypothetical protein